MEATLFVATPVTTDMARELALLPGLTVRDALVGEGLAAERLVLAPPKAQALAASDVQWRPNVQLSLSTQSARGQRGGAGSITLVTWHNRSNAR